MMSGEKERAKLVIESAARWGGERIVHNGKTIWAGLGNRSGLHDFANALITEKWIKSGKRFMKKVDGLLEEGGVFEIKTFTNVTRDRGRWRTRRTIVL